jgi:glycosyltransferase involved in cell wall biosynthesis
MKILFINHHHLDSNSGIHIFNLANQLTLLGVDCAVCVPEQKEAVKALGKPFFEVVEIDDVRRNKNQWNIDIIHAWTPREIVRLMTLELVEIFNCPYIVHLEDNEDALVSAALGKPISSLNRLSNGKLDEIIPPHMSHPKRYKEFIEGASGVTMLIDSLKEFCPYNLPSEVIWPGYEEEMDWALPPNKMLRQQLGVEPDERVVVYTGNVHNANRSEVFSLYLAIGLLNRKGIRTRIVRTGIDYVPLVGKPLEILKDYCIYLGYVDRKELPNLLSLADVLVQPGKVDQFNNYRFPSKLPEYLATGKPVVLPAANIGRYLKDGEEGVLLQEGHALEIARKLEMLFEEHDIRKNIGDGGRRFAENNLRWADSATKLNNFYKRLKNFNTMVVTQQKQSRQDIVAVNSLKSLDFKKEEKVLLGTLGKAIPFLSYATVKDYCDSADRFPNIMRLDGDLKDVQRPWMVKSILQMIPNGAKLLEIGGGEPKVADALEKLGFDVTIVDPYDGAGNGPQIFSKYLREYPQINIIKSYFDKNTPSLTPKSFDCIFSISVLEHVPHLKIQDVYAGISKLLKPGGCSIHCTDLVIAGIMADWHDSGAREILFWQSKLQNPFLDDFQIRRQVDRKIEEFYQNMAADLETYYHSAQGHNLWRGGKPYDEYPFNKIGSMQTCVTINSEEQN